MNQWVTDLIDSIGALGVGVLMFLENLFPPIPSELVMPLAGFTASQGELSLTLAIVGGSIGSLLGALFWYWVGRSFGTDGLKRWAARHGRWITMTPEEVDRADAWFDRHNRKAVFIGRFIPGVRTLISVPAGAFEMPFGQFLLYTALGTVGWTSLLAYIGYRLGESYDVVSNYVGPVSTGVVAILVLVYVYRFITFPARHPA